MIEVLANGVLVIILQYINVSELHRHYVSIISQ